MLVIDEAGAKLGEFLTEDALRLAQERSLDLVEVAPGARPPVCKITDYGRLKYDRKKREAVAKKNQVQVQMKEVKMRPKTDSHDMDVKVRRTRKFLEGGNKVRITIRFRGREHAHRNIGARKCLDVAELVKDVGLIEAQPRMDGRQMFMVLAPTRRPTVKRESGEDEEEEEEDDFTEDEDDDLSEEADVAGPALVAAEPSTEKAPPS